MPLPSSGPIALGQINVELSLLPTAPISLNDVAVRRLLEKPSGTISMYDAYGKSDAIRYVNTEARTSASIYALMGSPTKVDNYIFENTAEINANTGAYALRTGTFPAGSTLTIVNKGYIRGLGGAGSTDNTVPGTAGGDAIYLDMPCRVDNSNGYILAGGGGGGSVKRQQDQSVAYITASGGGGAGSPPGAVDINSVAYAGANTTTINDSPQPGSLLAGGAGGVVNYYVVMNGQVTNDIAYGGAGGANGAPGFVGTSANLGPAVVKNRVLLGVAGAAGRAIISNGQILTQISGFGTDRVKGAIV